MTEPLISVRALSKSFTGPASRPVLVLDGITLAVHEGEFVALLGRSGSGKSTLLRCIAGLIAPSGGEVLFRGERQPGTACHPGLCGTAAGYGGAHQASCRARRPPRRGIPGGRRHACAAAA